MSLNVEGQDCPVCKGHLFDDDDVVFCPVCGAPHHRDCYNSVGHCALAEFHGTDREYKRPETENKNTDEPKDEAGKVCKNCGESLNSDTLFCPHCGRSTTEPDRPDAGNAGYRPGPGGFVIDPLGGVPADEKIEDIPVNDVARYVAVGTNRYIPVFKKLSKKNRVNWNWAAFLFPEGWLWYRKCYKQGVIFLALTVVSTLLTLPYQSALEDLMLNTGYTTTAQLINAMLQNSQIFSGYVMITSMIGGLISLASRIVCGMFGDYIYRCSALEKIRGIKETAETGEDYAEALSAKGGVNLFSLVLAAIATSWIPMILSMFISG